MPGDGAVMNGSTNPLGLLVERGAEIGAFGLQFAVIDIAHLADRKRRLVIADRLARRQRLRHLLLEDRVALDIAARPALPAAAEPAHAVADIEEERLALLLAVVADIDAGLDLLVDDPAQRRLAEPVEFGRIDRFAAGPPHIEPGQLRRARQAAGMGRQDAVVAALHFLPPENPAATSGVAPVVRLAIRLLPAGGARG